MEYENINNCIRLEDIQFIFTCPSCKGMYSVDPTKETMNLANSGAYVSGLSVTCPNCETTFIIDG